MPWRDGMPIFVDEVAEYEIKGDVIHVAYRKLGLYLVFPLKIALAQRGAVGRALDEWCRTGSAEIIQFPEKDAAVGH